MAARGFRAARAIMHSFNGHVLHSLTVGEAQELVKSGQARPGIGRNFYYTSPLAKSFQSPANLTRSDMEGVVEHRRRAVNRVKHWPEEHDRRAVTVIAGRGAWIPDAQSASIRARLALQESSLRRRRRAATH